MTKRMGIADPIVTITTTIGLLLAGADGADGADVADGAISPVRDTALVLNGALALALTVAHMDFTPPSMRA